MEKIISTYSKPEFSIDFGSYINEVFSFIESKLSLFPCYLKKSSVLQNLPKTIEGENRITENLCVFLNIHEKGHNYKITKQDNCSFQFLNQSSGTGHTTNDSGVIVANTKGNFGKILVIEAKRLPTPGKSRKKEYLFGKLGGIERFRKGTHGSDVDSDRAIMIGYIQKENKGFWIDCLNSWIIEEDSQRKESELYWKEEDKIIEDKKFINDSVYKFQSVHNRLTLSKINLIHYWINLT